MTHSAPDSTDELLASIESVIQANADSSRVCELLEQARCQLHETRCNNLALVEAVANSASVIDELEKTNEMLVQAQSKSAPAQVPTLRSPETFFEQAQDAMLMISADGTCAAANQKAIDLLNLDRASLARTDVFRALAAQFDCPGHPDWVEVVRAELEQTGRARHEYHREAGEQQQWIEFSFSAASTELRQYLAIGRDMTAQRTSETELRKSRDFLRHALNALPDALCVKSPSLEPVLVNDQFRAIAETNLGPGVSSWLSDSVQDDVLEHERSLLSEGGSSETSETLTDVEGNTRHFSTRRTVFLDPLTGERFLVSATRDVTKQRHVEERNRSLASVFLNAREGVVLLDLDGNISDANPEFLKFTGIERSDLVNRNLGEILDWQGLDFPEMIAAAQKGEPSLGRVTLKPNACHFDRCPERILWGSLGTASHKSDQSSSLIAMFSDITQMEETQRRLHRQALHDNLTGLPNRRFFTERLEAMIKSTKSPSDRFGVCFLDLDDFKIVNDTLGHDAGDQLLIQVTERIKSVLYRDCFLARFGGDEFALLIPEQVGSQRIVKVANSVVSALKEPFTLGENNIYVGVSIGMTFCPDDAKEVNLLLRHADVAMYHAKEIGKNTVHEFTPALAATIQARQDLLNDLRDAVEARDVNLVFQPQLNLKTGKLSGCEALVRWVKNDRIINPADFIDVAETSGLIHPLGDQILELAMRQTRRWRDQGCFEGTVAINLSPRQLSDPGFIERFQQLLDATGSRAEWFELEITENAMIESLESTLERMEQIRQLGSSIAIDDFGTGYSSLNYLRAFPVSTLKLDLSFVRDLPEDTKAAAVAKTVLSLGHGLGLEVVAEGVENHAQYQFFREAGCDVIQGYFVNPPLLPDEFTRYAAAFSTFAVDVMTLRG